jgi:hypothetical protein
MTIYDFGSRYQATRSEDTEDSVRVIVNCKECELAIANGLYKSSKSNYQSKPRVYWLNV